MLTDCEALFLLFLLMFVCIAVFSPSYGGDTDNEEIE